MEVGEDKEVRTPLNLQEVCEQDNKVKVDNIPLLCLLR